VNLWIGYEDVRALLDRFVVLLQQSIPDSVVSVALYGSVARGEAEPGSDIDLLVVVEEASQTYRERLEPFLPILRNLRRHASARQLEARGFYPSLSVQILSREEADQNRLLYLDMIEDAHVLIDRDGFFRNRLTKLQHRLRELGSRRIPRGNGWYWDLGPNLSPGEALTL